MRVALLAVVVLLAGCPRREPLPDLSSLTPEVARLRLEKEGARRARVAAVVKARAPGWQGVFASADLDVVVEAPANMLVAVRSFFEQPMQVFATDGATVTLFDGTGDAGPRWYEGPVGERSLAVLLPIPIPPQVAVPLFLGRAPAEGARARNLSIDEQARTYTLELQRDDRRFLVTARIDDDVMTRAIVFTPDGRKLLTATLSEVRPVAGVPFAHRLALSLAVDEGPREVVLDARDVALNGPPYPAGAFLVVPPPGQQAAPLRQPVANEGSAPAVP